MITYGHPAISLKECKNFPPGSVGTSRKLCQALDPGTALLRVDNMVKGKAQTHTQIWSILQSTAETQTPGEEKK